MNKRLSATVLAMLLVVVLSSCSNRISRDPLDTGSSIMPDAIDSMYAEFIDTEKKDSESPSDSDIETEYPYGLDGKHTVYWYGDLPIYHTNADCIFVKTADNAESSTLAEALEKGRTDLCHECAELDKLK